MGADFEPRVLYGSTSGKPATDWAGGGAAGVTGVLAFDFSAGFELGAGSVFAGADCAGAVAAVGVAAWVCAGADEADDTGGSEDWVLSLQEASTPQARSANGTKTYRPRSLLFKRILRDVFVRPLFSTRAAAL